MNVLNVGAALATNMCGSGNSSPTAVFGASAHPPQAPIWLDPSGCPPGRVFHFCNVFPWTGSRKQGASNQDRGPFWFDRNGEAPADLRLEKSRSDRRITVMRVCGLTMHKAKNPVFARSSGEAIRRICIDIDFVNLFHRISLSLHVDSVRLRLRPFFSLRAC